MFLCREQELNKLNTRYRKKGLECVIIYGRRRVGKTALINEFVKDKPTVFFPALRSGAAENLAALSRAIHLYSHPNAIEAPIYATYDAAFAEITRMLKDTERLIFVIDELPYLTKARPSILSQLQHLIDHDWKDTGIFIILCGSSASFMEDEVLSQKSPLFGRRTSQLKIQPLSYRDTARFNPGMSNEDNALIYGITGGVPHYINKLEAGMGIKKALLENFFDTSSYLFEEPENLLKQELREPGTYNAIITAISSGYTHINEISTKTGIESAACIKYLRILAELGIVEKTEPIVDRSKRKTVYRISDYFFRFWYRFIPGNMTPVVSGRMDQIFDAAVGSYISDYMGLIFEDICRQYLVQYAEDLPVTIGSIGEWWGSDRDSRKEAQLDIVALDTKSANSSRGRNFIIGSCKYKNEAVGEGELELIRSYAAIFTTAHDTCYYYIFSKGGFTGELKRREKAGEVTLVSLDELYGK